MRHPTLLHLIAAACLLAALPVQAQLFRTYLASDGSDANPCTVQQPCRLLPAALAAVKDGGEVWMLDSANFNTGQVNIAKSVSILAVPGTVGSIVGNAGDAIDITAPGAKVALRNLKILNFNAGQNGIHMTNGASLKVEHCEIAGFTGNSGIKIATPATVTVVDTVVRDNYNGILFDNGSRGDVARATVVGNQYVGIWANPTVPSTVVSVTVTDSVSSNNAYGFVASTATSSQARMTVSRSTAAHNSGVGFEAYGSLASMIVSGSVASSNATGFGNYEGGTFRSLVDNTVLDNAADTQGTITTTAPR
jgi:hypothetical protein